MDDLDSLSRMDDLVRACIAFARCIDEKAARQVGRDAVREHLVQVAVLEAGDVQPFVLGVSNEDTPR